MKIRATVGIVSKPYAFYMLIREGFMEIHAVTVLISTYDIDFCGSQRHSCIHKSTKCFPQLHQPKQLGSWRIHTC